MDNRRRQEQLWFNFFNQSRKQPIPAKYVRASNSMDWFRRNKGPTVYAHSVSTDAERNQWDGLPTGEAQVYAKAKVTVRKDDKPTIVAKQLSMGKTTKKKKPSKKKEDVIVQYGTPSKFYRFGKRIHLDNAFGLYKKGVAFTVLH